MLQGGIKQQNDPVREDAKNDTRHIVQRSKGGATVDEQVVDRCGNCNCELSDSDEFCSWCGYKRCEAELSPSSISIVDC